MKTTLTPLALAFVLVVTLLAYAAAQPRTKPNIVFVLMDNLGYGEVGVYGGGILRGAATPRIDQLAAEGTRLLNFNVEAQCTPSRSAIMTGRYAIRSGTHFGTDWRRVGGPDAVGSDHCRTPLWCWIQTLPAKSSFTYFRIYGPEAPAFDGSWKPEDFALVK
jgi:hypothetical protein